MTTRRQRERQIRKAQRDRLLEMRQRKMDTAKWAFERAKEYHEQNCLPGVMYWEREGRLLLAQARNI